MSLTGLHVVVGRRILKKPSTWQEKDLTTNMGCFVVHHATKAGLFFVRWVSRRSKID